MHTYICPAYVRSRHGMKTGAGIYRRRKERGGNKAGAMETSTQRSRCAGRGEQPGGFGEEGASVCAGRGDFWPWPITTVRTSVTSCNYSRPFRTPNILREEISCCRGPFLESSRPQLVQGTYVEPAWYACCPAESADYCLLECPGIEASRGTYVQYGVNTIHIIMEKMLA